MNYSGIIDSDIANGEGVRVSLFVSGCRHHCKGCFNPDTWNFEAGEPFTAETEAFLLERLKPAHVSGLTLLGGEPLEPENQRALLPFLQKVRALLPGKTVWCYTGCVLENDLLPGAKSAYRTDVTDAVLDCIDTLVDGPFVEGLKDIALRFRGSSNQRIIDLKARRAAGEKRRVVILGAGVSGKAAADLLHREGFDCVMLAGEDAFPEGDFAQVVTSPGVPLNHPWQVEARRRGLRVVSELQVGMERWIQAGGKALAVTGSKGKSSVVKLVAQALRGVPCGNYGKSVCEAVIEALSHGSMLPWLVVEVSSFQLETTELPPHTFAAAAILNLQEDHLDRHGSVQVYHNLKRKLLTMARVGVDGSQETGLAADAGADGLFAKSYFDNPILRVNARCAIALLKVAEMDDLDIAAAFQGFAPLPHRMQTILVKDGVRWIDDSKSTSISSLCAGVLMASSQKTCRNVILIAGGLGKGDNLKIANTPLHKWGKIVYLIGRSANQLYEAWHEIVPCEICETMEVAVQAARRSARSGETVLLSPGAASFDQFKSYGERGEVFARLVTQGA